MVDREVFAADSAELSESISIDVRYTFTAQFLRAATRFSHLAADIEAKAASDDEVVHRGLVVGAIMQATAALETEIWEVMRYGPGHHLGSGGVDEAGRALLTPIADVIDATDVLSRYNVVLHVLGKDRFDTGAMPWQDAALVVRLRNELVHYKSRWGSELERTKFLIALESKGHAKPRFIQAGSNFFPHAALRAACAAWATRSCVEFLEGFYASLEIVSPLDPYRQELDSL
jgi:hypothetical protein